MVDEQVLEDGLAARLDLGSSLLELLIMVMFPEATWERNGKQKTTTDRCTSAPRFARVFV
jgi:hypothetical protein